MDAKLMASGVASKESKWLRDILNNIPMLEKPIHAILINCDNQATLAKVQSKNHNAKSSRHIELSYN